MPAEMGESVRDAAARSNTDGPFLSEAETERTDAASGERAKPDPNFRRMSAVRGP